MLYAMAAAMTMAAVLLMVAEKRYAQEHRTARSGRDVPVLQPAAR